MQKAHKDPRGNLTASETSIGPELCAFLNFLDRVCSLQTIQLLFKNVEILTLIYGAS